MFLIRLLRRLTRYSRSQRPRTPVSTQSTTVVAFKTEKRSLTSTTISDLRGRAHIIDGDTIVVCRTKIRLAGIDAPELDQPWGQKSKWAMVEICKGQIITVKLNGETSHDRLVGTAYLPDGRDIGAELIKRGLALDWALFSGGKYRHLEVKGVRRKIFSTRYGR